MNKITTCRLLMTVCILVISIFVLRAQSFQNTFNPVKDDNYVAGVAVAQDYWVIGNTSSFTPSLGTEHILFSRYLGATGASSWDRKYYDAANTTITYTATDIQAGYGTFISSPGNSQIPCTFTACNTFGPAVNGIGAPGSKNYFYVSGYYKDPAFGVRRSLMLKISSGGNILWARTNVLVAANVYDEVGVSAESCPNGDMIMVSSVTNLNTGLIFPAITRVDINGVLLWRYFYMPASFQAPYSYTPHQSCIFREFLNGNTNDPIGIAITGDQSLPGAIGSTHFVMRVAYNGAMIWKMNYPFITPNGATTNDQGWDIMFEAEKVGTANTVDNFVVTGLTNPNGVGPAVGCLGFLERVNVNTGAFVNCYRFGIPGGTGNPTQTTYGQGIYQASAAAKNVVITGGVNDQPSGIISDTYLIEMNITNGTYVRGHHYPLTTPNFPRSESVVSVGSTYPTPGYFISTNAVNPYGGGTLTDGHVIKTDGLGRVNNNTCLADTLKLQVDSVKSNPITCCIDQSCDVYGTRQMKMKKVVGPHVLCFSATKLTDEVDASAELGENEIGVYPNPVSSNEMKLLFTAGHSGEYVIRILDVNGRMVKSLKQHFEEGDQQFPVFTDMLPEGMYFITVFDGMQTAAAKFIRVK